MHDVLKCRVSNHQKIDVARRAELAPCRGSEQERNLNAIAKRREAVTEQIDQSCGLGEEAPQFRENRRLAVRLKIDLPALYCAQYQARCRQKLQFALNGSNRGSGLTNDLSKVVGLVGMPEEPAEHPSASAAEQDGCRVEAGAGRRCSQDENERNQVENIGQALRVARRSVRACAARFRARARRFYPFTPAQTATEVHISFMRSATLRSASALPMEYSDTACTPAGTEQDSRPLPFFGPLLGRAGAVVLIRVPFAMPT
jgi:hypothetical protein